MFVTYLINDKSFHPRNAGFNKVTVLGDRVSVFIDHHVTATGSYNERMPLTDCVTYMCGLGEGHLMSLKSELNRLGERGGVTCFVVFRKVSNFSMTLECYL